MKRGSNPEQHRSLTRAAGPAGRARIGHPLSQQAELETRKETFVTTTEKLPDLIAQLRDAFSDVLGPDDAGYEEGRSVYLAHHDRRPAAIVRPADANEVARVIEFAHERGFDLAVRSGGHSYAGHGVSDGALVLDLARLKALEIDVANHAAWAETGLTAAEVTKAL